MLGHPGVDRRGDVVGPGRGATVAEIDVQQDLLEHARELPVGLVEDVDQRVRGALGAAEQAHPHRHPVAGAELGEVPDVVLGREARVPRDQRPVLRDAEPDQRLVEPLAADAEMSTPVAAFTAAGRYPRGAIARGTAD